MSDSSSLPAGLQAVLSGPPLERKGWQTTTAPAFIAYFLWVVYFDQLGRRTLAIGGLGWSVLGAAVGGLLCYLLLYHVPATWGQKTGQPLTVLAASTFGSSGTIGLTFIAFGLAQILWLAVATFYAVDWTFEGLSSIGLFDPRNLKPIPIRLGSGGGMTFELRSPLFFITSILWIYAAALVGHYLVRIITALMNIYPIFPALMLAVATVLTFKGLPNFQPLEIDPSTLEPVRNGGPRAFLMMVQLIFGYFAMAGAAAADWGAVNRSPRDVQMGGWIGVAFASWVVATLALLTVAGALGQFPAPPGLKAQAGVGNFSFRIALLLAVPDKLAGAMFLVFGLSSLAQTCYAAFLFGQRFADVWPGSSRVRWTLLGTTLAWPLVALGLPIRLEGIVTILGAVFAPMVGAMAADYVRSRGTWPGIRRGFNPAGMIAWVCGLAIGLVPLIASASGTGDGSRFQPAAVFAFMTAFLINMALAKLGAEPPVVLIPKVPLYIEPSPAPEEAAKTEVI